MSDIEQNKKEVAEVPVEEATRVKEELRDDKKDTKTSMVGDQECKETSQILSVETTGKNNEAEKEEPIVGKKIRKRKKALHTAIRNQMEFYFSDANLSKDRYMQNAIKDGPDVSLDIFLNFNKLRSLTEDVREIAKALKYSTLLKLSDDETKVSRVTPVRSRSQDEVDLCTIYVEHLPPHATIEWVTQIFTEFGKVSYVSLPKFKDPTKIKGFAFVEFSDAESAIKAIKAYESHRDYATLAEDPGQLCSIQAFNAESREQIGEEQENELKVQKEKIEVEEGEHTEPQVKKIKLDDDFEKVQTKSETNVVTINNEVQEKENESNKSSKKKRKRNANFKEEVNHETQAPCLHVMAKKEWKKLRNKYLDMQRKCLRQLRLKTRRQTYESQREAFQETPEINIEQEVATEPSAEFQSGLIVKIVLDEPISDAKRFKSQVKCQEGVSYVEAQDCNMVAFVRCIDSEAAKTLVGKNIWSQSEILQGEEERDYWKKIEENRLKKRDKALRPKKSGAERARQKKIESTIDADQPGYPSKSAQHKSLHIRFDNDDNN